jgi:hypothetical protein
MKSIIVLSGFVLLFQCRGSSQNQQLPKQYAHKIVVDSIFQTRAYTYLKVRERINGLDSLQWMALPLVEPKIGDVYYYDEGLQMGEFQSKELNRSFNQILFLNFLSTSAEVSVKNMIPLPVFDTIRENDVPPVLHQVVVKEVLQANGYTYLRVKEGSKEEWLAVVKIAASPGQIFTYKDAAPMTNFTSKELKRTFDEVLFISKLTLSTDKKPPLKAEKKEGNKISQTKTKGSSKPAVLVTIAKLLENKQKYDGKLVLIKGEVTKFTGDILEKNWIHIKDIDSPSAMTDLTVTCNQPVKVGDVIQVEGKISLNKDYGSGYFFSIIMEDASLINR